MPGLICYLCNRSGPPNKIDQAFINYQQTGDPADLGQVFDATASKLLQLAHHLSPEPSAADDLVQATFLTVIEHKHKYKPTGHVVAWLFAILANEARSRRRALGRTLKATGLENIDTNLIQDGAVQNPQEELERKELTKAVMEAIGKMPELYHPILNFHLRYGLSPSEIGLNLNRPASTVRKQLARGLELLRQSLPASFIAGSVVLTTPATGLAAMREVVMGKASAAASASPALILGKLALWTAAGTLTAAALAVSIYAPDEGQVTFDELSPKAKASVVAQKGTVDSSAIAISALQADPYPASSRIVKTFSSPVSQAPGGANTMTKDLSHSSLSHKLGVPGLLLGAMTLLPTLGQSQSVIYYYSGENGNDNQGFSVSDAGDVNLDGTPDIVVGAKGYDADPDGTPATGDELADAGRVYVYSGKDGTTLWTFTGENASDKLGWSASGAGDVNVDGFPDIMAGAYHYDTDPDGTPATGDELSDAGRVYVYSGKDGTTLWTADGEAAKDNLGTSGSSVGDVNSDGNPDVVASAPFWDADFAGPDGTANTLDEIRANGRVYVYSGKDGTTLYTVDGENGGVSNPFPGFFVEDGDNLGFTVSGAGDVNGDGTPDVVAGAISYDADPDGTPASGDELSNAGRVYAFSGKDGTTLYTFIGEALGDQLGFSVSGAGDVNLDTYPDIVAGARSYDLDPDGTPASGDEFVDGGRVYAFSGKDGTTLWTFDSEQAGSLLGTSVSDAGDVNGDSYADIVAAAFGWSADPLGPDGTPQTADDIRFNGRVYVYSGKNGATLYTVDGENGGVIGPFGGLYFGDGDFLGNSVSGAGDMNGDGTPDILAGAPFWDADPLGPDGTAGTGDESMDNGRAYVISSTSMSLTADKHLLSLSVANSQTMTIDAGVVNAGKNYWLFTGFAASGDTPGVVMAPGVVIPLNQPDPLTSFVIGLTQLGGGAPTFVGWKSTLDGFGKGTPSLNTFGPTPAPLGITLHHAALVYTSDGCGVGCDTFQKATNWVPMTTTP